MIDQVRALVLLPFRPRRSMSVLLDGGGVLAALLLAALASALLWYGVLAGLMPLSGFGPIATVAGLVFLYTPATLLLLTVFDRVGSFGVALRRDFGGLLVCMLSAFTVAFLPAGVAGLAGSLPVPLRIALVGAAALAFAALVVVALQTACGANLGPEPALRPRGPLPPGGGPQGPERDGQGSQPLRALHRGRPHGPRPPAARGAAVGTGGGAGDPEPPGSASRTLLTAAAAGVRSAHRFSDATTPVLPWRTR
jgi:hypothetical protein